MRVVVNLARCSVVAAAMDAGMSAPVIITAFIDGFESRGFG
jgi:hypothetical protein